MLYLMPMILLEYLAYDSITHDKLTLQGTLSDIFLNDLLGEVKRQKGIRFVMRSREDIIDIAPVGQNDTVYTLHQNERVISTNSRVSMSGVITKINVRVPLPGGDY